MNITCPSCGCNGSLELFMADREFREAILSAADLPSNCGALVLRYIGLFRPMKRQLTPSRAAKLIAETLEFVTSSPTIFGKQEVHIPAYMWQRGLQAVLDKPNLTRPLKNHNLLIKIAITLATQRDHDSYTEENEPAPRAASTGSSMKSIASIVDKSADADTVAEKKLSMMTNAEHMALRDRAKQELMKTGIEEKLIIKPMIDGMVLSIIKENV
ncbi:MAG: hypothetical protein Q9N02_08095 [Ghiorsea sp.]|nr:hypothetical protein [Ghiorsea sp.]